MAKLDEHARMTIQTLAQKGLSNRETARLLGITEGAVRYQLRRMQEEAPDGRSQCTGRTDAYAEAIDAWRTAHLGSPINLAVLHEWLVGEHDYEGSLRSVQRYWKRTYPAPKLRARRRIETPPGAQSQVDWAHFPGIVLGGCRTDLVAFRMALSHSRYAVVVWSHKKDQLAWHRCHNEAFRRLGGVTATVRVDNEKTAVVKGAGAWGVINPAYRRYARLLRFHVDACAPRQPQAKGKVERAIRTQRFGADPWGQAWRDLKELQAFSDEHAQADTHRLRCPATGTSVFEAWQEERLLLTPLPEPLWEPFDVVATRKVSLDALVAFEGRHYSVPFAFACTRVEVHGCAETVQVLHEAQIIAVHPRHTAERLLIDPQHYEGDSTERVEAPPPLGRLGRRRPSSWPPSRWRTARSTTTPRWRRWPDDGEEAPPACARGLDRTRERLLTLGLGFAATELDRLLAEAVKETTPPHAFLDRLLAGEIAGREERRIARSLRLSNLPMGPTLTNFDFAFQPAVERSRIETLATSAWVRGAETVLLQGPPGVGKTHLAVGLGIKAIEQGFSVQFYRFDELLTQLRRDAALPPSKLRRKKYLSTMLLVIDELGFEPMDRQEASLFFRLVTYRYGRGAILITTNKSVRDWTELLAGDEVLATAILDRLLHHAHVINIKGRSYRLRELEETLGMTK